MAALGPFEYTCVDCDKQFLKDAPLKSNAIRRCDTCKHERAKASKLEVWNRHKTQYRATQRARKLPEPVVEATVEPEPLATGRVLPNGSKIVWMARDLI